MTIRLRKPSIDDKRIFRIIADELIPYAFYRNKPLQMREIKERLRRGITLVVCSNNGLCRGFIHLIKLDHAHWIDLLAVERRNQGCGYGTRMLMAAELIARRKGSEAIRLFVDRGNRKAIQFYEHHGYLLTGYEQAIECYKMEKRTVRSIRTVRRAAIKSDYQ